MGCTYSDRIKHKKYLDIDKKISIMFYDIKEYNNFNYKEIANSILSNIIMNTNNFDIIFITNLNSVSPLVYPKIIQLFRDIKYFIPSIPGIQRAGMILVHKSTLFLRNVNLKRFENINQKFIDGYIDLRNKKKYSFIVCPITNNSKNIKDIVLNNILNKKEKSDINLISDSLSDFNQYKLTKTFNFESKYCFYVKKQLIKKDVFKYEIDEDILYLII